MVMNTHKQPFRPNSARRWGLIRPYIPAPRTTLHPLRLWLVFLLAALLLLTWHVAEPAQPTAVPLSPTAPNNSAGQISYGVNFINSVDHPADSQQFSHGASTGAGWNRWPLYWSRIETSAGHYDWSQHDAVVTADQANGWRTNAILLGTPPFYTTNLTALADCPAGCPPPAVGTRGLDAVRAATPQGLYNPIFSDGTDTPGAGKQINPNNPWAQFVFTIVQRYKPSGTLAQAQSWPAHWGITHWEMWNEPDFVLFWDSSLEDYARLLKVGYLAAKTADPQAQILFGGLANNGDPEFYGKVLNVFANDPQAHFHAFYHDIFATHNYSQPWMSWFHVWKGGRDLAHHGLSKPIWLNESGVPAWDDYPGPVWDPKSGLRATTTEQADFVVQNAFFALFAGADAIFHFQLYDGCGNQPAFTDFPPHNGELCDANGRLITDPTKPCAGDANGLFTNPSDAICFSQHPTPASPRPNFNAFHLLTTHLQGVEPLWRTRPGGSEPNNGPQEIIALYKPSTGQRFIAMWARFGQAQTAIIAAQAANATLIYPDGTSQTIFPSNGFYQVQLPAATNQNAFWDPTLYMIGGSPRILVEQGPATIDSTPPTVTSWAVVNKPDYTQIALYWQGNDHGGSGMQDYSVAVAVDNGPLTPWLTNTAATHAIYESQPGHRYQFEIRGRDYAGNLSTSRTQWVFTFQLPPRAYLPLVAR